MKKTATIFLLGLTILFSSCSDKKEGEYKKTLLSNFVDITDNEDKGIKEIINFYGGECHYSIGRTVSTNKETIKYFQLEIRKSTAIEKYASIAEMPASNVAYRFYKNLEYEKDKYDEIHVVLELANGEKLSYKYPVADLEIVKERMPVVEKIVELIKEKQFSDIMPYLNDASVYKYDKHEFTSNMEKLDPQFGQVKKLSVYGFRIEEHRGSRYLHISAALLREIQNHEFSVDFDLSAPKEELLKVEYKF